MRGRKWEEGVEVFGVEKCTHMSSNAITIMAARRDCISVASTEYTHLCTCARDCNHVMNQMHAWVTFQARRASASVRASSSGGPLI